MSHRVRLTFAQHLGSLPPERRAMLARIRSVIRKHLPKGYVEAMGSGTITYSVPLSRFAGTYNGQPLVYAALASHKSYVSLYLMGVYGDPKEERWLRERFRAAGKELDMGKSCVRFRQIKDVPLDVIGAAIARTPLPVFLQRYKRVQSRRAEDRR